MWGGGEADRLAHHLARALGAGRPHLRRDWSTAATRSAPPWESWSERYPTPTRPADPISPSPWLGLLAGASLSLRPGDVRLAARRRTAPALRRAPGGQRPAGRKRPNPNGGGGEGGGGAILLANQRPRGGSRCVHRPFRAGGARGVGGRVGRHDPIAAPLRRGWRVRPGRGGCGRVAVAQRVRGLAAGCARPRSRRPARQVGGCGGCARPPLELRLLPRADSCPYGPGTYVCATPEPRRRPGPAIAGRALSPAPPCVGHKRSTHAGRSTHDAHVHRAGPWARGHDPHRRRPRGHAVPRCTDGYQGGQQPGGRVPRGDRHAPVRRYSPPQVR